MTIARIDFQSPILPSTFFCNAYSTGDVLEKGGCINETFRKYIPGVAIFQEHAITAFYLNFLKKIYYESDNAFQRERQRAVIRLSQEHISRCFTRSFMLSSMRTRLVDLERYVLAARLRINDFSSDQERETQKNLCKNRCQPLFSRWQQLHLTEEIFWTTPDLVDFVMKSFLQKVFQRDYYKDGITMQSMSHADNRRDAYLLVKGKMCAWKNMRNHLIADENEGIYSLDNEGGKIHWWYLDGGLRPWDKKNWAVSHPLITLKNPPLKCEVHVITSHAKKDAWYPIIDRYLEGVRHTFIRVVFRQRFEKEHPCSSYKGGQMYSFGYIPNNKDLSVLTPLATIRGRLMSPDYCELGSDDLCVTAVPITDEKALQLMDKIVQFAHEQTPYHFINANCAKSMTDLLAELQIAQIPADVHLLSIWYRIFIPEKMRLLIDKIRVCFTRLIPSPILSFFAQTRDVIHSILISPLFLIIGGLKVNIDPLDTSYLKLKKMFKPFFCELMDILNPRKMIFKIPKVIYTFWQKKQPGTYFERH